jgi:predicted metal-binding membrane protein
VLGGVAIRSRHDVRATLLAAPPARHTLLPALAVTVAAWVALVALDSTGIAARLHHHALIEDGPPPWLAIPFFLVAWQVMVAAMMVPASLPAIRTLAGVAPRVGRLGAEVAFITGFFAIWTGFGLAAFLGDMAVHRVVDSTPWLASRPWLIEACVLALAGVYQFAPRKRRDLETCRQPGVHASTTDLSLRGTAKFGLAHGIACVGASGALMLLMFGEGFGGLAWMIALTVVMVLETSLRSPRRLTTTVGIGLVLLAVATLAGSTAF